MKILFNRLLIACCVTAALNTVTAAPQKESRTPKDPGVINQEQIVYWLTKRGELSAHASDAERAQALREYTARAYSVADKMRPAQRSEINAKSKGMLRSQSQLNAPKTVKVLGALIDFPDLPYDNNRLSRSDTDMYYSSYPVSHYQDMLFSTTGFTGPSNQTLLSGHQYYLAESGSSLLYTGKMHGWVRANNNADYYGGNDASNDDADKKPRDLVREAIVKILANTSNQINLNDYDIEDPYDLDNDSNLDEPDGIIDHVTVFHSSIGEEAGGGVLGDNAIWSHRAFVSTYPGVTVTDQYGTSKQLFGYTIQPIDAAVGVVVHEFGHDLGLPDEYDSANTTEGEPIGFWSVMAGGSWAGNLPGSKPTSFSPYARDYLQSTYGGNWATQLTIDLDVLKTQNRTFELVDAHTHDTSTNQIKVTLPLPQIAFSAPYNGDYQYYSGKKDDTTSSLSFSTAVPDSASATLALKAHWIIEPDYDYVLVKVNGTAIAGNHTISSTNPEHPGVVHYLTSASSTITGAEGSLGWVNLNFNLAAYRGQNVTISVEYVTDASVLEKGFVVDGISVGDGTTTTFTDDSEVSGTVTLDQFSRVGNSYVGEPQNYWLQLRSYQGNDAGLGNESYSTGVTLWFADQNYSENDVEANPGYGFLSVVDADQLVFLDGSSPDTSDVQVRDAAFSRFAQLSSANDRSTAAIMDFDDSRDYSAPQIPQAGTNLSKVVHGLRFNVSAQANDSRTASIQITAMPLPLTSLFTFTANARSVVFSNQSSGGVGTKTYAWNFGDGNTSTLQSPNHNYLADGTFSVTLEVRDAQGTVHSSTQSVTVTTPPPPPPPPTPPPTSSGGGGGAGSVGLALLALGLLTRYRK